MRLNYFLSVIVAATLHASGTALTTTKDSNHATAMDLVPTDAHYLGAQGSGRMLRKVNEESTDDEEERGAGAFTKWLKHQLGYLKVSAKKRFPGTYENKIYRNAKNAKWNSDLKKARNARIRASMD